MKDSLNHSIFLQRGHFLLLALKVNMGRDNSEFSLACIAKRITDKFIAVASAIYLNSTTFLLNNNIIPQLETSNTMQLLRGENRKNQLMVELAGVKIRFRFSMAF